ncbi:hypothetical protein [Avrilella dinanensis]|uniref:Uncharacterized protein n=1 Tax=Avrilella dinanensis TaxID=2008672 RepID=A0A2M9R7N5_9FLAO|nr:hypothetical protein [Avrilella dinanensis]PJR04879.1 hypothetical protein CDL10_10250 [Avrilella dinanensis]
MSISLNTYRTHPDNLQDGIKLKNMLNEAKERILNEFDKKKVASLLAKTETIVEKIDINNNLDSLHIFLSNDIFNNFTVHLRACLCLGACRCG